MKRLAKTILFLLLFMPLFTSSQTFLSLKGGVLNTSFMEYSTHRYVKYNISFHNSYYISLDIAKHISEIFSLGTSVSYDNYQFDYKVSRWGAYGPTTSRIDYNIQAGYLGLYFYPQFSFGNKLSFYFNFGPYFGIYLHSLAKGQFYSSPSDGDIIDEYREGNAHNELYPVSISIMSSFGLNVELTKSWNIFTEFIFRWGTPIINGDDLGGQLDMKFGLGMAYRINNKRMMTDIKSKQPSNY